MILLVRGYWICKIKRLGTVMTNLKRKEHKIWQLKKMTFHVKHNKKIETYF